MRIKSRLARRFATVMLASLVSAAAFAPLQADARAGGGGSFGSRGTRTFSAPPPTATSPGAAPIQRSITQPGPGYGAPSPATQAAAPSRGIFGGGLGTGFAAGLLGAGLFGLLGGSGFFGGLGSASSLFGFLIQLLLIFFVARMVMGWLGRRSAPQTSGGPTNFRFDDVGASRSADASAGRSSPYEAGAVSLTASDFDAFEALLTDVQAAWTGQDLTRMRSLATPEMTSVFAEELSDLASRGLVNQVGSVKLLQGDLAEAWREGARDYATVAMRYGLTDVTLDASSGRVVEGDAHAPTEVTEFWTFMRSSGGRWLLSAIQQQA